jgi:hypothetical protein
LDVATVRDPQQAGSPLPAVIKFHLHSADSLFGAKVDPDESKRESKPVNAK